MAIIRKNCKKLSFKIVGLVRIKIHLSKSRNKNSCSTKHYGLHVTIFPRPLTGLKRQQDQTNLKPIKHEKTPPLIIKQKLNNHDLRLGLKPFAQITFLRDNKITRINGVFHLCKL